LIAAATCLLTRRRKAPLEGNVVAITGGSRGLGLAVAREFAARGASLALIARDEAELQRAAEELRATGAEVSTWAVDLTQGDGCETLLSRVVELHGALDVLINNAGEIVVGPPSNRLRTMIFTVPWPFICGLLCA